MMTHCQPSDPPSASAKQLAFMAVLFPGTLLEIFSLLEQRDCLNCMTVCRDWFDIVPEFTKSLWKTVDISRNGEPVSRKCWERCLGEHVMRVNLRGFSKEHILYNVLQKLLDLNCTNIESLDLVSCTTTQDSVFLNLLRKFPLTHLRMLLHRSNVPFAHVFNACPSMTHFTYQFGVAPDIFDKEPVVPDVPSLADEFPSIVYLCLDVPLDNVVRLEPLLKRCPNLKCYVGVCTEMFSAKRQNFTSIDCEKLLTYCPKLSHLVTDWSYQTLSEVDCLEASSFDVTKDGLRYFSVTELRYSSDKIRPFVASNQSTIEHLHIKSVDRLFQGGNPNWYRVFVSLAPPNLRTLVCNGFLTIDGRSLAALLSPSMETLKIGNGSSLELNKSSLLQSLPVYPQLHTFECNSFILDTDYAVIALFERLPALEQLTLSNSTLTFVFFTAALGSLPKLKHLDLADIKWKGHIPKQPFTKLPLSRLESVRIVNASSITYELLLSFVHSPALTDLDVSIDYGLCGYDVDGLRKLVETLSNVKSLKITNLQRVPFAVFDALAKLPLRDLVLDNGACNEDLPPSLWADKKGLLHMLNTSKRLMTASLGTVVVVDNLDEPRGDHADHLTSETVHLLAMRHAPSYQMFFPDYDYEVTRTDSLWETNSVLFKRKMK